MAVAQPREAVIPVAFAPWRLGKRGRQRRDGRARRHVRQALDRQRGALERLAPAVVGDPGAAQPAAPELGSSPRSERRHRRRPWGSRSRWPRRVSRTLPALSAACGAPARGRPRRPECHVGRQADRHARARRVGREVALVVTVHSGGRAPVVEDRFAGHLDLDGAVDAVRHAHEHVSLRPRRSAGRVCGVTVSSPRRGPRISASCTSTQPVGVFHVVTSTLVPGVVPARGTAR